MQPTISFHSLVDAVAHEQEEADALVAVTKKFEPAYLKEVALAPLHLLAMQTALMKLAQDLAALKQVVASSKKDSPPQTHRGDKPLHKDPEEDRKC